MGCFLLVQAHMSLISIVVPTHNENANVEPLYGRLVAVFDGLPSDDFELIFCDDSTDSTPEKIASLRGADPRVKLVRLSRRSGQAIAVTAGIDRASGDALIMMDADLQDPRNRSPRFWNAGAADMKLSMCSVRAGLLTPSIEYSRMYFTGCFAKWPR